MGRLAPVLEALYRAPRLDGAMHVRARQFVDHDVFTRAHEARARAEAAAGGSRSSLLTAVARSPSDADADLRELWWAGPGRWRVDHAGAIRIGDGDDLVAYSPATGAARHHQRFETFPQGWAMVEPRVVSVLFDIDVLGRVRVAGRSCFDLVLRPAPLLPGQPFRAAPVWFGDEARCRVDRATGLIVGVDARFEGSVVSSWTTELFETPRTIDPAVFDFTPPEGFRDPLDLQVQHLRQMGVDLTGVDATDADAVNQAMQRHFAPPDPTALAAQHVPTGPPPDDPVAAERAVREVVERMVTPSADGASIPAVEGGSNLGSSLQQARQRAPGGVDTPATITVHHVKFVNPDEAVVWFSLARGSQVLLPQVEGRVRRRDGRWLVARPSFCGVLAGTGVRCPPPPAEI